MGRGTAGRQPLPFEPARAPGNTVKRGQPLVAVVNKRRAPAPFIDPGPDAYVSVYENSQGWQYVFVQERGEKQATLYIGSGKWTEQRLDFDAWSELRLATRDEGWLASCLYASSRLRPNAV